MARVRVSGGIRTHRYLQIDISAICPVTTWTQRSVRLAMFTALYGGIERHPMREFADDSPVTKSFGGMPYVLRKSLLRRLEGSFFKLTDAQVTAARRPAP